MTSSSQIPSILSPPTNTVQPTQPTPATPMISFNDSVSLFVTRDILTPLSISFQQKGINVSVEEMTNILNIASKTPSLPGGMGVQGIPTLPGYMFGTGAATLKTSRRSSKQPEPVDQSVQCIWMVKKRNGPEERCPYQQVDSNGYCKNCLKKKTVQKLIEKQGGGTLLGNQMKSPDLPGMSNSVPQQNELDAILIPGKNMAFEPINKFVIQTGDIITLLGVGNEKGDIIRKISPYEKEFATKLGMVVPNEVVDLTLTNVPTHYNLPQQPSSQQLPSQQLPSQQLPSQQLPSQQLPSQQSSSQQLPSQQLPSSQIPQVLQPPQSQQTVPQIPKIPSVVSQQPQQVSSQQQQPQQVSSQQQQPQQVSSPQPQQVVSPQPQQVVSPQPQQVVSQQPQQVVSQPQQVVSQPQQVSSQQPPQPQQVSSQQPPQPQQVSSQQPPQPQQVSSQQPPQPQQVSSQQSQIPKIPSVVSQQPQVSSQQQQTVPQIPKIPSVVSQQPQVKSEEQKFIPNGTVPNGSEVSTNV